MGRTGDDPGYELITLEGLAGPARRRTQSRGDRTDDRPRPNLHWLPEVAKVRDATDLLQRRPDTEQRPAIVTVSVQEYVIADVWPVFGNGAGLIGRTDSAATDEIGASVYHNEKGDHWERTNP
jgi:hypothetical protein